jgi:hypothetical protein
MIQALRAKLAVIRALLEVPESLSQSGSPNPVTTILHTAQIQCLGVAQGLKVFSAGWR